MRTQRYRPPCLRPRHPHHLPPRYQTPDRSNFPKSTTEERGARGGKGVWVTQECKIRHHTAKEEEGTGGKKTHAGTPASAAPSSLSLL